jgi:hypothetical protein
MGQPMLLLCLLLSASARAAAWLDGAAPQPAGFGGPRSSFAPRAGGQRRRGGHAQPPPQPRVQLRAEEAEHVFDVTKYGAVGDNATDDTAAFDKALKAAFASGGGMVQVPPGLWVLAGNLTVPPGVSLTGSYRVVPSHDLRSNQPITDGTVLIPTGGRGSIGCEPSADPEDPESPSKEPDLDCEEAFITIAENGLVQGLVVWYKEQERIATPVPYPWTFFLGDPKKEYNKGGSADNAAIMDVEVLGCWNCIAAVEAHRHYIARIQGHPINIGVFVDATYDIGRIEDVHFNPWYSDGHPFYWWQTTHGRAFVFGRSDWEYVFNTFAFACKRAAAAAVPPLNLLTLLT